MGNVYSAISQSFPPKSNFSVEDIPDLTGKVIIVTGANTGLGKETAKALLARNAKVYVAARSEAKATQAIEELREATGKEALFLQLDLGDLKAVKAAAQTFMSKETELHVLYNNAGVMWSPMDQLTVDGYDLQFGTNVLGHFFFAKLLLPVLIKTAKTSPDGKTRIVNTSSMGHMGPGGGLEFNSFKDSPARRKMNPVALYHQSKFGNIVYATEVARRYGDQGIVSTSLNPGNIGTDVFRNASWFTTLLFTFITYDVHYGVLTPLWAGTSAEGATLNGRYLIPWARIGAPLPSTQDPELGKALWTWLEEQVEST